MFYTMKPGLLVSMNTQVKGNVSYTGLDRESTIVDRTETTDIHTRKLVTDIDEQEAAIKERTKIRGLILSLTTKTADALLCPNDREAELREAIAQGHDIADKFNASAATTRIEFSVICGRIAQDDVETVRAITSDVRSLLDEMKQGVKTNDPKMIRDAANELTQVGKVLTPEAAKRLQVPIESARAAATLVKKLVKSGELAAIEVDRAVVRRITAARTSFLDMNTEVAALEAPEYKGRALDL